MTTIKSSLWATLVAAGIGLGTAHTAQAAISNPLAAAINKVGGFQSSGEPNGAAGALVVNLSGTPSIDALNDAANVSWVLDAAPEALVDAVSYELTLSTFGSSWLSEASVLITNSSGQGVRLRPGYTTDAGGSASFSGAASLLSLNMAFNVGPDGKLKFQFYEEYDDAIGSPDALFTAGSITLGIVAVTAVPEPATYLMVALGLLGIASVLRGGHSRQG